MTSVGFMSRVRETFTHWRSALSATAMLTLYELGSRIGVPGVDARVVHEWFTASHGPFLQLYNFIAGGGTSRGALLALGIVPYVAARIYLFIGRSFSPAIRRAMDDDGKRTRAISAITLGIAVVQAFGYVMFVSRIPNAVAQPGPLFVLRTTALLTGGALAACLLGEQLFRRNGDDADEAAQQRSGSDAPATPSLPLQAAESDFVRGRAEKVGQSK